MCFSATASFTSAAVLSGAGVYNLAIMRKKPAFWAIWFPFSLYGCYISSYKQMRIVGVYGVAAFSAAYLIKAETFTSAWCFFSIGMTIPITFFLYGISANKNVIL